MDLTIWLVSITNSAGKIQNQSDLVIVKNPTQKNKHMLRKKNTNLFFLGRVNVNNKAIDKIENTSGRKTRLAVETELPYMAGFRVKRKTMNINDP